MDINRSNFWQTLPTVLEAISLSEYVAIDLEMTGVSGHAVDTAPENTEITAYQLAAEAARTFQVLQFGMTCLSYDDEQNGYQSKTFTFHLTPEFAPPSTALAKLIDRKVVLSYRSFLFLKENNFSFEKAFSQGVPYLSRPESALASKLYLSQCGLPSAAGDQTLDTWLRKFQNDTRADISAWLETNPESGDSVLITSPEGPSKRLLPTHVLIIRRLIQAEFPGCFVVFKQGNLLAQVVKWNQEERQLWDGEYKERHEAVVKQTGKQPHTRFRYVVEALVGGSFAKEINAELLVDEHLQGAARRSRIARLHVDLRLYEGRIKQRRPVIVGHNPFLDLCFIQETFLRPLPDDVAAFRRDMGEFFPRVVDTKYLSSQLGFRTGRNLEQLYKLVGQGSVPITPMPGYDARDGSAHNAGFDSWMTAAVFM
ncbi:dcd040fb-0726-4f9f-a2f4-b61f888f6a09 [Thermothielavioides terrestris]|uniref:Dcd040fb-0726-4f9f-a2f4-b61f888f6a09 n=1 Tax=Thermothielavioides terrestris TaxID=2587410 RepID=A0A446BK91_9PEZI|nr:dcd040fb-0726-4f9f-a2f4-b61f888f6a09 [Thermothielavioides terrestris]